MHRRRMNGQATVALHARHSGVRKRASKARIYDDGERVTVTVACDLCGRIFRPEEYDKAVVIWWPAKGQQRLRLAHAQCPDDEPGAYLRCATKPAREVFAALAERPVVTYTRRPQ